MVSGVLEILLQRDFNTIQGKIAGFWGPNGVLRRFQKSFTMLQDVSGGIQEASGVFQAGFSVDLRRFRTFPRNYRGVERISEDFRWLQRQNNSASKS